MATKVDTFANRLRLALDMRQVTQTDLANASGVSKSSISHYMKGSWEGKQDAVYALAEALHVSEAWLMGYDAPIERNTDSIPPGFEPLPHMIKRPLIGNIACGEAITAEQNIEDYIDVPEDTHCDFCLRCKGDSMIEANINDGDVVYIRKQPEVENGEIAAVRIGDEATLKRVYWDGDVLVLAPANSRYLPKTYSGEQLASIRIEGKAVGFTHWF